MAVSLTYVRPGATDSLFRVADELILASRLKKCPIFENAHFWRVLPHGMESQESSIFVLGSVVWCMSGCILGGEYKLKVMKNPCKYNGKQKKIACGGLFRSHCVCVSNVVCIPRLFQS